MNMATNDRNMIGEIKRRVSIAAVVERSVELKKIRGGYVGLCPFHADTEPSFHVYMDTGRYHCFGCKVKGDVFDFLCEKDGLSFGDALEELAKLAGVELPTRRQSGADRKTARLNELLTAASSYYRERLLNDLRAEAARKYLSQRGVTAIGSTMFQLGFAPDCWDELLRYLKERGYKVAEMVAAGVVARTPKGSYYDHFRGRIIFPIKGGRGQVVGFGGRLVGKDGKGPKYLNGPATSLFDKGSVLYGLDLAAPSVRKVDLAVIVEGYLDAVIAHQQGEGNVVATLGTALSERHITALAKLTRHVVLALDGDRAGDVAALTAAESLRLALEALAIPATSKLADGPLAPASIRIARLPQGCDPDEVIRRGGGEWGAVLATALPVVEHCFQVAAYRQDLATATGRVAAESWLTPIVAAVMNDVERNAYVQQLAELIGTPVSIMRPRVEAARVIS